MKTSWRSLSETCETNDRGLISRGLQPVLAFLAAFEEIADAGIELRLLVDIVRAELVGLKNGKVLRVQTERGIGAKICGDFFRLALLNRGTHRLQGMIVQKRQTDGIIQRDACRG